MNMQDHCTTTDLIRSVFPCNALKLVARVFCLPIDTARAWIYRNGVPAKKLTLFYEKLLEENERELERRIAVRLAIRRQIEVLANARLYEADMGNSDPVRAQSLAKDMGRLR